MRVQNGYKIVHYILLFDHYTKGLKKMSQEKIIIEGSLEGVRFYKELDIVIGPEAETPERAIIRFYGSDADNFEKLAREQGWRNCYWTYADIPALLQQAN